MIEIIVGVWIVSLVLSGVITALNIRFARNRSNSQKYRTLNQNLEKVGLYWSLSTESFADLKDGSAEADAQRSLRSYIYLGSLGFLSALGLIFLVVLSLSLQVLLKGRLTQKVFASDLTQKANLSTDQVSQLVTDLKNDSL